MKNSSGGVGEPRPLRALPDEVINLDSYDHLYFEANVMNTYTNKTFHGMWKLPCNQILIAGGKANFKRDVDTFDGLCGVSLLWEQESAATREVPPLQMYQSMNGPESVAAAAFDSVVVHSARSSMFHLICETSPSSSTYHHVPVWPWEAACPRAKSSPATEHRTLVVCMFFF